MKMVRERLILSDMNKIRPRDKRKKEERKSYRNGNTKIIKINSGVGAPVYNNWRC